MQVGGKVAPIFNSEALRGGANNLVLKFVFSGLVSVWFSANVIVVLAVVSSGLWTLRGGRGMGGGIQHTIILVAASEKPWISYFFFFNPVFLLINSVLVNAVPSSCSAYDFFFWVWQLHLKLVSKKTRNQLVSIAFHKNGWMSYASTALSDTGRLKFACFIDVFGWAMQPEY